MPSQKTVVHGKTKKGQARYRLRINQIKMISEELRQKKRVGQRCILITSIDHSFYDSFLSFDMATTFAEQGMRTVLVDANIREKSDETAEFGLINALHKGSNITRFIHPTKVKNLSYLPYGRPSIMNSKSWQIERLLWLKQQLTEISDVAIIESHSYLNYLEIQMLAKVCEDVVVVVRKHKDKKSKIQEMKRDMETAGIHLTGLIFQPH
ncbi:hypothetical protein [Guptibacillus algicola]|uniref:hypothetical protein n=1 Tax=Guptibacillus algicola TaxID=225844 RepID=UPI001CD3E0AD|nr:hypothetical protein [Alkalihalobacillus algicola]MCA0987037.1 hypothetical protein [Alkalihalobacillus algicola]